MNSNIDSVKIQKWPRWCIGSLLLYALLVSPSLIIRYNAIAKNFGALLLALSMFSLIMYFYKNRHLQICSKFPRTIYTILLTYVSCSIFYGAFIDNAYVPLTFWGNIDYAPAFLLPLFVKIGMRKENVLWLLKVLAYFSLLTLPMFLIDFSYTLYIGWTLFFPLAFAKFLPKKLAIALIVSGICYASLCWFDGARTPVIRTIISMLIAVYTYLKPIISRRLANWAAIATIVIPFYYFFLYVTTGFSIFDSELSSRSSSLGDNSADTRTFLYEEILDDLQDTKTIWFGKGINGKYSSPFFSHNSGDNEERQNPEVGFLSYLLKGGIVYTVIVFLLLLLAVIRILSVKDNIIAQIFGLLIVQHIFLLFIENIPQYTLYNAVIWSIVGFAFSPNLYDVNENTIGKIFNVRRNFVLSKQQKTVINK